MNLRSSHLPGPTAARIAYAAALVVARDGLDVLSVRTVAREAAVAAGTVQHHYATREDLLAAAFEQTVVDISARLAGWNRDAPVHDQLVELLSQLLPLDEQRRVEGTVWVALSAAATSHPSLARIQHRGLEQLHHALVAAVGTDRGPSGSAGADPRVVAAVLGAVVDGLTLQGITGAVPPPRLRQILAAAITALVGPAGAPAHDTSA